MTFLGIPYKYLALAITIGIVISVVISMIFGMILTYTPLNQINPQIYVAPAPSDQLSDNNNLTIIKFTELLNNNDLLSVFGFIFVIVALLMFSSNHASLLITLAMLAFISYLYPMYMHMALLGISVYIIWYIYWNIIHYRGGDY